MLYASVPLTGILMLGLLIRTASPGSPLADVAMPLGIGGDGWTWWLATTGAVFSLGILGGWTAGSFGHELMHRPTRAEWSLAQLLLARGLYAPMAIEHVFGHHRNVGFASDIATAPRGETFWQYLPRAIVGEYRGAFGIELAHMRRLGLPWFSPRNRFLQGVVLQLVLVGLVLALAGPSGLAAFAASAFISIVVVETGNYVSHYGLVRVPGGQVAPRHSWNAPRFFSTSTMVNLPRHSHHHRSAGTPYWELTVLDDAPVYPFGTAVMSTVALYPPWFFSIVEPRLADWDDRLASDDERALLGKSGLRAPSAGTDTDSTSPRRPSGRAPHAPMGGR
jgi:alkane 1-monooxygenase